MRGDSWRGLSAPVGTWTLAAAVGLTVGLWLMAPLSTGAARAEPVPVALDTLFTGEVVDPAEPIEHVFEAPAGTRLIVQRVDSSNPNKLNWVLEDSHGRLLDQDLGSLGTLGPVTLMGGSYVLRVQSEGGGLGTYDARLVTSVIETLPLALGEPAEGAVTEPGGGVTYVLDVPAPGRVAWDTVTTDNSGGLNYRLTDPWGRVVYGRTTNLTDPGQLELVAGDHLLEVLSEDTATGSFTFVLEPSPDAPTVALTLGTPTTFSLDVPGAKASATLTLDEPTRLFLDQSDATNGGAVNLRMTSVDGDAVLPWTTNANDQGPFLLGPGTYTLDLRLEGVATGAVTVTPVATETLAVTADVDTPWALDLAVPASHAVVTVEVPAPGLYFLDTLATSNPGALNYLVTGPEGRVIVPRTTNLNDVGPLGLAAGTHTVELLAEGAAVGTAEAVLHSVTDASQAVAVGATFDLDLSAPGQTLRFPFSAIAGQPLTVTVETTSNAGGLNLRLTEATSGRELVPRTTSLVTQGPLVLQGGDYLLEVLGEAAAVGTATLTLTDPGPQPDETPTGGTPIALGEAVSGSLPGSSVTDVYTLTLAEPTAVHLDVTTGGGNPMRMAVYDPVGQPLETSKRLQWTTSDDVRWATFLPGTWTFELYRSTDTAGDYGFTLTAATDTTQAATFGDTVEGTLDAPGDRHTFTLDAAGGESLFLDLLAGDGDLLWALRSPEGDEVFADARARFEDSDDRGPYPLTVGTWELEVWARDGAAPAYGFAWVDAQHLTAPLAVGVETSGALASRGGTLTYEIALDAPTRVVLDTLVGDDELRATLVDPFGQTLLDARRLRFPTDDYGALTLPAGTSTLTLDADHAEVSAWTLTLREAPLVGAALTLGAVYDVPLDAPATTVEATLELVEPTRVYIDVVTAAANVYMTLARDGGPTLIDGNHANVSSSDDRGPWTLAPGTWRTTVVGPKDATATFALAFHPVEDTPLGTLPFDEILELQLATPGERLIAEVEVAPEPPETARTLDFDLLQTAAAARWTLTDPVGTDVWTYAKANTWASDDEIHTLAAGTYTLTFDGENDALSGQALRIQTGDDDDLVLSGTCAACGALDIAFVFDTSASMNDNINQLCDLAAQLVQELAIQGIPVNASFYGVTELGGAACLTQTVSEALGSEVPGGPPEDLATLGACVGGGNANEDWALATAILAERHPWAPDAVRLVVPVADEGPLCGDPIGADDRAAIEHAVAVAQAHGVVVSPLLPQEVPDPLIAEGWAISDPTLGVATVTDFAPESLAGTVAAVGAAACDTASEAVTPQLVALEPAPGGEALPAGQPIVLSGLTERVNGLRPIVQVLVDGEPAPSLDAAGRFFAPVTLEPGANALEITLVEDCGSYSETVVFVAEAEPADGLESFVSAPGGLEARFDGTTFHAGTDTVSATAAVEHLGEHAVDGPVLMLFGPTVPASVSLDTPDGHTTGGEPYRVVVPPGDVLEPGALGEAVPIAFHTPERVRPTLEPRFLVPTNHAPVFTTAPPVTGVAGVGWTYDAAASDPDGHALSWALVLAPAGMTVSEAGTLSWTPPASAAGLFDVAVVVDDGRGGSAVQRFTVAVGLEAIDTAPVWLSAPTTYAPVGGLYLYDAHAADAEGDTLTYTLVEGPEGMACTPDEGVVTWGFALPGQHVVRLRAADPAGNIAEQAWLLAVGEIPLNAHAPIITSTPPAVTPAYTLYAYTVVATDPDGDVLGFTLLEGPDGMGLHPTSGQLMWTPGEEDLGTHVVSLKVDDGLFGETTQTFSVTVLAEPPNVPPLFLSSPPTQAVADVPYAYAAEATDPELGAVSYALAAGPAGMTLDPVTGALAWTPAAGDAGFVPIGVTATDPEGAAAHQVWLLDVRASNTPPALTTTPGTQAWTGEEWVYDAGAFDADGDPVTWTLGTAPGGATVDPATGVVRWTPPAGVTGEAAFVLVASDGLGGDTPQPWTLDVQEDLEPPEVALSLDPDIGCASIGIEACVGASDDVGIANRALLMDGVPLALDSAGCAVVGSADPATLELVATATDPSGKVGQDTLSLVLEDCGDGNAPVVELVSPQAGSLVSASTPIVATITDDGPTSLTWTVEVAPDGVEPVVWQLLAEGEGEVDAGTVAVFDALTRADGTWRMRIVGSDGFQTGGIEFVLGVGGGAGDPDTPKPGTFSWATQDVALPVAGIPLTVARRYDSLTAAAGWAGDLAPGWSLSLGASVTDTVPETDTSGLAGLLGAEPFTRTTRVVVTKPDGSRAGFTFDPVSLGYPTVFTVTPAFRPDPGVTDTLELAEPKDLFDYGGRFYDFIIPFNADGYVLKTAEGLRYTVSEADGLQQVADVAGNTLDVTPGGVVSSLGLALSFVRDEAGRITEIVLPDPDPDDAEPAPSVTYAYDDAGRLVASTTPAGATTTYAYDQPGQPALMTAVLDPTGAPVQRAVYDEAGLLAGLCGPDGDPETLLGCWTFAVDAAGGLETVFDAEGHRRDRVYDEAGRLSSEVVWLDEATPRETTWTYDVWGNVATETGPDGGTWAWTWDARGHELSVTDPGGHTWATEWDAACDQIVARTDPQGRTQTFTYDAACQLASATTALGATTWFTMDPIGQPLEVELPDGGLWTFTWSPLGAPETVTDPYGSTATFTTDAQGRVSSVLDRNGRLTQYVWDDDGRLLEERWDTEPETVLTWTYDEVGNVLTSTSPALDLVYTRRADGKPETLTASAPAGAPGLSPGWTFTWGEALGGDVVAPGYDLNGRVVRREDGHGGVETRTWDALGRLASVRLDGDGVAPKQVDATYGLGLAPEAWTRFGGADGLDAVGRTDLSYGCSACPQRLAGVAHAVLPADTPVGEAVTWARDASGAVTSRTDSAGTATYLYDGDVRLLSVDRPDGDVRPDESYGYDALGRRTSSHVTGAAAFGWMSLDGGRRLLSDDVATYEYDAEGNRTRREDAATAVVTTYAWDHRNRLVGATVSDSDDTVLREVAWAYDGEDDLVRVTVDGVTRHIAQDGRHPVLVLDDAGEVLTRRLYATGYDRVLAEDVGGVTRWALTELNGTVATWVDDAGTVLASYTYDAFGRTVAATPADGLGPDSDELRFQGRPFDAGTGLAHWRARVYDAELGRFLSEDPLWPFGYGFGLHDPLGRVDPFGQTAIETGALTKKEAATIEPKRRAGCAVAKGLSVLRLYLMAYMFVHGGGRPQTTPTPEPDPVCITGF